MNKTATTTILAVLLAGCSGCETPREGTVGKKANSSVPKAESIYIARTSLPAQESMIARFEGKLLIVKGCLVFKSDATTYLPVFSAKSDIEVETDRVIIGGQETKLGQMRFFGGGEVGEDFTKTLIEPVPSSCKYKLLKLV